MKKQTKSSKVNLDNFADYVSTKDMQILRRIRETYKLKNKLERYQKKLILEGFKVIENYGLHVNVHEVSDNYVNTTRIVELAKIKYPSLYGRYNTLQKKYLGVLSNLEILVSE